MWMGNFTENLELEIWLVVCSFIYNAGGADDLHVHNEHTFELLSANSAAIVSILILLYISSHLFCFVSSKVTTLQDAHGRLVLQVYLELNT